MRLQIPLFLLVLTSCGTIQKMAMRSTSPMFKESSNKLTRERDWDFFRESAPGNLKFLELMYLQDPDNTLLLGVLIKGYSGYAYAVHETSAYEDELAEKENSISLKRAIQHHTRAFDYGLDYLEKKNVSRKDLLKLEGEELFKKLSDELDKDDLVPVLYTAQAWGSLINLQKDNVALVSQVPKVKSLFDWACAKDPKIDHGVCDIFAAQYEASRPRMLGGNPQKAEELYRIAISKYPKNLLIRVGLLQYLYVPAFEKEKYEIEAKFLKEEFAKWESLNRDSLEDNSEYKTDQDLNLYTAIAKKRFESIEKYKNKIFGE